MNTFKKAELEEKVKQGIVKVLGEKVKDIFLNNKLLEDLGMDSFASLELIFELESELNLNVSTEDAKGFVTVKDIVEFVWNKLKEGDEHVV